MAITQHTQHLLPTQEAAMPTTALETLRDIAENMSEEDHPYSRPADKFRKALRCVEEAKVVPALEDPGLFKVTSSDGQHTYLVTEGTCDCLGSGKGTKAPWACYHASAAELYNRWQRALDPAWNPWAALAQASPSETVQEGAQATITPNTIHGMGASGEHNCAPARGQNEASRFAPPYPIDVTPVRLPGGGERTTTIGQLMGAMARAQARMENPMKDALNPHLNRRFLSLAAIRDVAVPALAPEGITVTQWYSRADGELICWTMLAHQSGEYQIMPYPVPAPTQESGRTAIQTRGSTMSYARRYGLGAATCVVGEDDDDGVGSTGTPGSSSRGSVEKVSVPDMTQAVTGKSPAALREEIETLAKQQKRNLEYLWGAAKQRFGRSREELTVEDLDKMLKGLHDKGAA